MNCKEKIKELLNDLNAQLPEHDLAIIYCHIAKIADLAATFITTNNGRELKDTLDKLARLGVEVNGMEELV